MVNAKSELTGRDKAAILLIALGRDASAKIFTHLKDEEIEQLTLDITNMRRVEAEVKDEVIYQFYEECLAQNYISEGGIDYAKDVLEKAIGSQKALEIISKLTSSLQVRPFDFVRKADPSQLLNFIQNEHPQTIALIFSYLPSSHAATVLSSLSPELQSEVVERIAKMERTSPEYIKEIERVLERKLSQLGTEDFTSVGGVDAIVEILTSVDRGTEKNILETLESRDVELADEIRRKMFVFEDIIKLDKRAIQRVLRDTEQGDLTIALKGATQEVTRIIFDNVSKRQQQMIEEEMEFMGPVRLKDVEEAQQKIVNVIRQLEESGEIIIMRGEGDEMVV